MNCVTLAFVVLASVGLQTPSPLGDDAAKFDQLIDSAYFHRDVAFVEAAVADDLVFGISPVAAAPVWNKEQFLAVVRSYDARERTVDGVHIEAHGDVVETRGHIQVKATGPDTPELQIYFVRLYRHGPNGWQLMSHHVVRQVTGSATPSPTPGVGTGTGVPAEPPPPGVFRAGSSDVTLPPVLREVRPQYTADAMRAKIQGAVLLEAVVNTDGTVGNVRVVRSLDKAYGLDEQAIMAAKQWRFAPGTKSGEPVPVMISIELT